LFFNLPARRKFLRSEETERAHIQHYLTLAALAWPGVGFTFVTDGRPGWQLPPVKWSSPAERFAALRERLRQLHGADVPLLPVEFSAEVEEAGGEVPSPETEAQSQAVAPSDMGLRASDFGLWAPDSAPTTSRFRVWGFIGAPGVSRSTREDQHIFVNQRPVENRGLNFALLEGYHTALMKGRYPVCCLFLEVDPAAVDVNVHPQKREVKRLTLAMLGRASPRKPMVAMAARSSARWILEVAWRSRQSRASSRLMPAPSSVTRMRLRPPAPISTVIRAASASRAFSTSSFTTLAGRSTTSPAAIWFATWSGRRRMRFTRRVQSSKFKVQSSKFGGPCRGPAECEFNLPRSRQPA